MQRIRHRCPAMDFEDSLSVLNDLQLAAELGKTLLERNKELETNLRQQQNVVEDRNQEIEYLTKQTAALREVNDSRLRIYEQLEISIQDLERNNQRLVQENANDKKQIKNLYETIESLESRCEDLQHIIDDMGHSKKDDSLVSEGGFGEPAVTENQDEYTKLVSQLEHAKNQRAKEQRKVSELEQNVSILIQENTNLEEKVCVMQQKDQELKTLQDQIVYLEEIRQGNLCRRCQRSTDPNLFDEYSVYDDDDDTDDISAIGSYVETHKHEVLQQLQETLGESYSEDNPYRILVDKYEALLKIQQQKHNAFTSTVLPSISGGKQLQDDELQRAQNHGMSLQEELQNLSGTFSSFNGNASDSEDDDAAAVQGRCVSIPLAGSGAAASAAAATGCKYSETETTSSSGFSDETSNKATQTETFFTGSFLCTISDGDDCRFSIYDDASPVESRFRKTPEYRQLFREIFAVLKRAAEAKDEGERLPLLQDDEDNGSGCGGEYDGDDDSLTASVAAAVPGTPPRVPPATPACEHNPFVSSVESAVSAAAADVASDAEQPSRPVPVPAKQPPQEPSRREAQEVPKQQTRRQRDIIEELASVKHKKHARHHHRKSAASSRQQSSRDISHLMEFKWTDKVTRRHRTAAGDGSRSPHRATWCVPSDCSPADSPADPSSPAHQQRHRCEYASVASQVAQLKLLDKSYAEVLRLRKPPPPSSSNCRPQSQYFSRK